MSFLIGFVSPVALSYGKNLRKSYLRPYKIIVYSKNWFVIKQRNNCSNTDTCVENTLLVLGKESAINYTGMKQKLWFHLAKKVWKPVLVRNVIKLQKQLKNSDRTINFGDCSARLVLPGIPKQSGIQHRVSTNTLVLNTTVLILLWQVRTSAVKTNLLG